MLVRPQDGKAKMCLRDIHFCLHLELFVYSRFKDKINELNFQSCFRGLEVRLWADMPRVPGSNPTQAKLNKNVLLQYLFIFLRFFQK